MTGKACERPPSIVPGNPNAQTIVSVSAVKSNLTGTLTIPDPITSKLVDHIPPWFGLSSDTMVKFM